MMPLSLASAPIPDLYPVVNTSLSDIGRFSRAMVGRPLRRYQLQVAEAIVDSVMKQRGLEFAVLFPRQSGKNETQAQIEAYLLNLFQRMKGASLVKAQPTFRPQAHNALRRLSQSLNNPLNRGRWARERDYALRLGQATAFFFSAAPNANVVGATASLLLQCDEAQDVRAAEWERKFVPMGASTNVTIVYWGTAWTSRTLLAQTIRALREQEARDGVQRVFVVTPEQVAAENPAYGQFVAREVARKGRQHPLVKTQYFNEEIDAEGGMFPPARRALMQGTHPRQTAPTAGRVYALLIDVAGEDEAVAGRLADGGPSTMANPRRDSTVLTVVEVDLTTARDPVIAAPTYRCVDRRVWTGERHTALYAQLRALALMWRARHVVVDATGVGAGLAAFLTKALPEGVVISFHFSSATKSQLGWDFLAVCDSGRWQDYAQGEAPDPEAALFWRQVAFCEYSTVPGTPHTLRWGVPEGTRDPATGELVHDDALMSAALSAVLDRQTWSGGYAPAQVQPAPPPNAGGRRRGKF